MYNTRKGAWGISINLSAKDVPWDFNSPELSYVVIFCESSNAYLDWLKISFWSWVHNAPWIFGSTALVFWLYSGKCLGRGRLVCRPLPCRIITRASGLSRLVVSVRKNSVWYSIKNASKLETICYSLQSGGVFLDVVHLRNLRSAVAQEVGHLAGRECKNRAIGLFHTVYQLSREMVSEAVEALLLYPCGLQNSVVPFAEVYRAGVVALLVAHEGRIRPEVAFLA